MHHDLPTFKEYFWIAGARPFQYVFFCFCHLHICQWVVDLPCEGSAANPKCQHRGVLSTHEPVLIPNRTKTIQIHIHTRGANAGSSLVCGHVCAMPGVLSPIPPLPRPPESHPHPPWFWTGAPISWGSVPVKNRASPCQGAETHKHLYKAWHRHQHAFLRCKSQSALLFMHSFFSSPRLEFLSISLSVILLPLTLRTSNRRLTGRKNLPMPYAAPGCLRGGVCARLVSSGEGQGVCVCVRARMSTECPGSVGNRPMW